MKVFSIYWKSIMGGGTFIYTRSEKGFKLLKKLTKREIFEIAATAHLIKAWNPLSIIGKE